MMLVFILAYIVHIFYPRWMLNFVGEKKTFQFLFIIKKPCQPNKTLSLCFVIQWRILAKTVKSLWYFVYMYHSCFHWILCPKPVVFAAKLQLLHFMASGRLTYRHVQKLKRAGSLWQLASAARFSVIETWKIELPNFRLDLGIIDKIILFTLPQFIIIIKNTIWEIISGKVQWI